MTRVRHVPLLTLFLAVPLVPASLPHPTRAEEPDRAAQARELFDEATERGGSVKRAASELRKLSVIAPHDPLVLAYAGSAATLVGRDASSPLVALRQTEDGLDLLDRALRELGPQHDAPVPGRLPPRLETLLVAASTFAQVPDDVFHRLQDGKAALSGALAHPAFGRLPPPVQARFHWVSVLIARAEQQREAERAALERVTALDPSGPLAGQARTRLAELAP